MTRRKTLLIALGVAGGFAAGWSLGFWARAEKPLMLIVRGGPNYGGDLLLDKKTTVDNLEYMSPVELMAICKISKFKITTATEGNVFADVDLINTPIENINCIFDLATRFPKTPLGFSIIDNSKVHTP